MCTEQERFELRRRLSRGGCPWAYSCARCTALPGGTVTFLFSDIEGSTRLLQELGDDYAQVVDDHRRIMRAAMEGHGGTEIDTQGDAFFFSFTRAKDAADAAVEAQRALADARMAGRRAGARADGAAHR